MDPAIAAIIIQGLGFAIKEIYLLVEKIAEIQGKDAIDLWNEIIDKNVKLQIKIDAEKVD